MALLGFGDQHLALHDSAGGPVGRRRAYVAVLCELDDHIDGTSGMLDLDRLVGLSSD
ncbi:hypothetical protein D3C85_1373870 [compost metagenome]